MVEITSISRTYLKSLCLHDNRRPSRTRRKDHHVATSIEMKYIALYGQNDGPFSSYLINPLHRNRLSRILRINHHVGLSIGSDTFHGRSDTYFRSDVRSMLYPDRGRLSRIRRTDRHVATTMILRRTAFAIHSDSNFRRYLYIVEAKTETA
jgi:hypothetical protein